MYLFFSWIGLKLFMPQLNSLNSPQLISFLCKQLTSKGEIVFLHLLHLLHLLLLFMLVIRVILMLIIFSDLLSWWVCEQMLCLQWLQFPIHFVLFISLSVSLILVNVGSLGPNLLVLNGGDNFGCLFLLLFMLILYYNNRCLLNMNLRSFLHPGN